MSNKTKIMIIYLIFIVIIGFISFSIDFLFFKIKADYFTKQVNNTILEENSR